MEKMLEAKKDGLEQKQEEKTLAIWDLGSPLYDSYEVVALTHLIERQLMTLPFLGGSERLSSKMFSSACDDHAVVLAALLRARYGLQERNQKSTFLYVEVEQLDRICEETVAEKEKLDWIQQQRGQIQEAESRSLWL
ncbi:hypothetical protein OIU74_007611 [Salix koriyanagi]|uniref:Uncharacterized protein n=1 Tax=Salix koriyanagi TaxID=2511006 RepID=A0A9Q0Z6L4_9ROSI|nr:hypothetical protein OIU74_007611 [Salix koriyanagi]